VVSRPRMKRSPTIVLSVLGVGLLILLAGGMTQRTDRFAPDQSLPLRLPKAIIFIEPPMPDDIASSTCLLSWQRPRDLRPMFTVFAFDPAYEAVSFREVQITVDQTNHLRFTKPEYGQKEDLKPYELKDRFRDEYPGVEPRHVAWGPFEPSPLIDHPPTVGSRVRFRVDLDILAQGQPVCSTNYQADFVLERKQSRVCWGLLILARFLMPRF
jgi:hypothetical protein